MEFVTLSSEKSVNLNITLKQIWNLLLLWFSLTSDVGRFAYAATGFGLMAFKYLVEAGLIYEYAGKIFSPVDFVNPAFSIRYQYLAPPAPDWLAWVIFAWSLPFLWIAVTMSVRRAANAGVAPWIGLLVFVPVVNLILMLVLACLPQRSQLMYDNLNKTVPVINNGIRSALLGMVVGFGICLIMVGLSVYFLSSYGASLFLGTPLLMGAASASIYNRPHRRTLKASIMVGQLSILLGGFGLLIFAFEGIICLVMLYPIAVIMGLLGSAVVWTIAATSPQRSVSSCLPLIVLPLLVGAETVIHKACEYEVSSSIEIDALPELVWPHVIGFSELPSPPEWFFRLGIAYPCRATIEGTGVGAIRYCEFSTGPFVEPITVWDAPRRLSFDVVSQPAPMHELSPYRHVHPPHLDGYLRCKRGEFRLIALPEGRTRLEGSTWYEFDIYPQNYWTLWSDLLIHQIHGRVLEHIRELAETRGSVGRNESD